MVFGSTLKSSSRATSVPTVRSSDLIMSECGDPVVPKMGVVPSWNSADGTCGICTAAVQKCIKNGSSWLLAASVSHSNAFARIWLSNWSVFHDSTPLEMPVPP